jgi:hypothetical protein
MARWPGMEAGIAMKSGNADGVKASTADVSERTNIFHTQGWDKDGKRPDADRRESA